ncbi:MAG: 1-(5-phosphoribosyl)-5-[(5-phosphoribosylamino)methylideneamino]imidazole-4-carboxamide isomerase [Chloroflexi bacterium]|nr:1-(5-phosphoribosyl)-5-[(5-phosphoribosylamino)methylideneamino]imidazole-4-carboxamide isomerase [Chloroflexota bacterium]
MEIIPAVDLCGGKCVRLYQGDYARETVYSENPVAMAQKWESLGARRLHVVDLDGAAKGEPCNLTIVKDIVRALGIPVQFGGGLRTIADVERVLEFGARRVILGTAAVENSELVAEACRRFTAAIIIGVDARDGHVVVRGWREGTTLTAAGFMKRMAALGARRFAYTDVSRDGTLTEPNFEAIGDLLKETDLSMTVAGGIASVAHLTRLAELGVEAAIVGKALYCGSIDLCEALGVLKAGPAAREAGGEPRG